jgi:hypothetical protein
MSQSEQALVRAMIIAAKFPAHDVDWMVASCPSVARCKEVCLAWRRR